MGNELIGITGDILRLSQTILQPDIAGGIQNGIQEVSGSIPLISTMNVLKSKDFKTFFLLFPAFRVKFGTFSDSPRNSKFRRNF